MLYKYHRLSYRIKSQAEVVYRIQFLTLNLEIYNLKLEKNVKEYIFVIVNSFLLNNF